MANPRPRKPRRVSNQSLQLWDEILALLHVLWLTLRMDWALLWDPRVKTRHKLMLIGIAIYVVSPIDPIPDVIPILGQLDDVVVLIRGSKFVWDRCPADVVAQHRDRIFGPSPTATPPGQ